MTDANDPQTAFFDVLAGNGLLGKARELAAAVVALNDEIVTASKDQRNWGPAKALSMAAEKSGVNPCDSGMKFKRCCGAWPCS